MYKVRFKSNRQLLNIEKWNEWGTDKNFFVFRHKGGGSSWVNKNEIEYVQDWED